MPRFRKAMLALALLVVVCVLPTRAEDGDEAAETGMSSAMTRTQVDAIGRLVGLTDEQRPPVMDLFQGYRSQFDQASKKLQEFEQSLQGGGREMPAKEDMKKAMEAYKNFMAFTKKLDKQFLENYKALLTPEQAEKWPRVERRLRIGGSSGMFGPMSGGGANLAALAEQTIAPAKIPAEAQPLFEQYEIEMDQAVTAAIEWREKFEAEMEGMGEKLADMSQEEQMKFGMKMQAEAQKASEASNKLNASWLGRLAGTLPEAARVRFQLDYYREGTLRWYVRDDGSMYKALDAAAALPGLSDEQKASLAAARASFDSDLLVLYKASAEAQDQAMKKALEGDGANAMQIMGDQESMQKLFTRRPEIFSATVAKVRAIFTPEQLTKLPEPLKPVEVTEPKFEE